MSSANLIHFLSAMPLTGYLLLLLLGASSINADSEEFGLMSLNSGYLLHLDAVYANPDQNNWMQISHLHERAYGVVTDNGTLKFTNGTYASIGWNGQYSSTTNASNATTGFSIQDGELYQDNNSRFYAIPYENEWNLYSYNATGSNGNTANNVAMRIGCFSSNGTTVSDFTPPSTSSMSSSMVSTAVSSTLSLTPVMRSSTVSVSTTSTMSKNGTAPSTIATSILTFQNAGYKNDIPIAFAALLGLLL